MRGFCCGLFIIVIFLTTDISQLHAQEGGSEIGRFVDKTHVISLGAARQTMDAGIRATVGDRDPVKVTLE
jgi:hypothetical protein